VCFSVTIERAYLLRVASASANDVWSFDPEMLLVQKLHRGRIGKIPRNYTAGEK
jgi:hypothetical protein